MVPLSALLTVKPSAGPERVDPLQRLPGGRHQRRRRAGLFVGPGAGRDQRIAAETLPPGIGFEWTDLTYQEILAGNSGIWVFPLAMLLVFLVLAAQYESLTLPLAIILIVPMCLLSAMVGVWLSRAATTTSSRRSA